MSDFENMVENLRNLLDSNRQCWLLGAGISLDANIPLMKQLTIRVKTLIAGNAQNKEIYELLSADLDTDAHIEHYLSHLGDLIALAERSKDKQASIGSNKFTQDNLKQLHSAIIKAIGETVRYGYKSNPEEIGELGKPIINIDTHRKFVKALLKNREGLNSRSNISFVTTNYDTLLEDAMALEKLMVIDGFSGGAMGFWNPDKEFNQDLKNPNQYFLYKLHGSVDWHRNNDIGMVRARYGTNYLSNLSEIMIYPQATKYVETQKDPFANIFTQFRSILNSSEQNVLVTCGYSFGDEHINAEIESALNTKNITIIAFTNEVPNGDIKINKTLDDWLTNPQFGERVFVAGENGLYNNSLTPINNDPDKKLNWWKFSGLIESFNTREL